MTLQLERSLRCARVPPPRPLSSGRAHNPCRLTRTLIRIRIRCCLRRMAALAPRATRALFLLRPPRSHSPPPQAATSHLCAPRRPSRQRCVLRPCLRRCIRQARRPSRDIACSLHAPLRTLPRRRVWRRCRLRCPSAASASSSTDGACLDDRAPPRSPRLHRSRTFCLPAGAAVLEPQRTCRCIQQLQPQLAAEVRVSAL